MTSVQAAHYEAEDAAVARAAGAGDEVAFTVLAERYRRELHVHCYRMLASFDDAEDLVQDTFLRAWKKRASFQGRSTFRAWLYRIATNACLDFLRRSRRRVAASEVHGSDGTGDRPPHIAWLQPYPDRALEPTAPRAAEPDALVVSRETIGLAFLVAVQLLPPRQRAILILRDVLGWSAKETAELLDATVASVNAALLRARATLRTRRRVRRPAPPAMPEPDERERALVQRYADASERADPEAIAELLREDVRFAMPPESGTYIGRELVVNSWVEGGFGSASFGDFRCVVTRANRMPAVVCYVRKPGKAEYRAFAVDVLEIENGEISEITAFPVAPLLTAFALPETL